MKIFFDNVNFSARTGPNVFGRRLAKALYERGHEIVGPYENHDIHLAFIEPTTQLRAGVRMIQRLDGIWFKPENFEFNNRAIKSCYDSAHAVIWQSEFDQRMTQHHWGARSGQVIHNGIDMTPVPEITIPELAIIRGKSDMLFVSSANWHPQKRLSDNILLFQHLRQNFYPKARLIVLGNAAHNANDPNVLCLGSQPAEVYLEVMAASNWMLHLAWLDHCPNVVIEAMSQGTPVICSSEGGTKELVKDFGVILNEPSYDFRLTDYDSPPRIDVTQVSEPLPSRLNLGNHADIDINNVALRYEETLKDVLSA